jgi:ABC-type Na+ efflux pump permease subunit
LAIVWLILTQIMASAMGGYLAGRLRTKWTHVHTDEIYFRDTAHGFLAWAVSMVITAAFLATAAVSFAGESAPRTSGTMSASEGGMLNA